jgi:hypothetical protein
LPLPVGDQAFQDLPVPDVHTIESSYGDHTG